MAKQSGKTARLKIGVWLDGGAGDIRLGMAGEGLVRANPAGKRGHPHLCNKLARALRTAGKPHPPMVADWNCGRP